MPPLYLVGCSSTKLAYRAPAEELYTSDLFRASRDYAEALAKLHGSRWMILSAKHGLLDPDDPIDPYDVTLASLAPIVRRRWAWRVVEQLEVWGDDDGRPLVVLAGKAYADALRRERPTWGWEEPLRGLQIGERRRWLRANTPPASLPLFEGVAGGYQGDQT